MKKFELAVRVECAVKGGGACSPAVGVCGTEERGEQMERRCVDVGRWYSSVQLQRRG